MALISWPHFHLCYGCGHHVGVDTIITVKTPKVIHVRIKYLGHMQTYQQLVLPSFTNVIDKLVLYSVEAGSLTA